MVKCALHIHSKYSHDGQLSLAEIAAVYGNAGFQVVCLAEHSQDLSVQRIEMMKREAEYLSGKDFLLIVGIEYSCDYGLHIVGVGCEMPLEDSYPVLVANQIRAAGCFSVLAHPRRYSWQIDTELAKSIDAVEIWNVRYDGKYLPLWQSLRGLNGMRIVNPNLLAIAGDDFHGMGGYYPLTVKMDVDSLCRKNILRALIAGRYTIESKWFNSSAETRICAFSFLPLRVCRMAIDGVKRIRSIVRR